MSCAPRSSKAASASVRLESVELCFASSRHLCYDKSRMSARILISGLLAVLAGTAATYAPQAERALYAKLAKALFARFYAKLLIPRLGT